MTDIKSSDVYRFIEWVRDIDIVAYHLARAVIHGKVGAYEVARAADHARDYPDVAREYDFIGVLAGGVEGELEALKEEATRELVADFYAAHDSTSLIEVLTEIRDLARTGLAPDVYPSEEDWLRHKCNRIAADADRAIREATG